MLNQQQINEAGDKLVENYFVEAEIYFKKPEGINHIEVIRSDAYPVSNVSEKAILGYLNYNKETDQFTPHPNTKPIVEGHLNYLFGFQNYDNNDYDKVTKFFLDNFEEYADGNGNLPSGIKELTRNGFPFIVKVQ